MILVITKPKLEFGIFGTFGIILLLIRPESIHIQNNSIAKIIKLQKINEIFGFFTKIWTILRLQPDLDLYDIGGLKVQVQVRLFEKDLSPFQSPAKRT